MAWFRLGLLCVVGVCCANSAVDGDATTIAIDVGHSRAEPGATSARGVSEFTFNRSLALALRDVLQTRGAEVRMIGDSGDAGDLRRRAKVANGADLLVSIHHDSVQPRYLEPWEFAGKRRRLSRRFAGFSLFVSRQNVAAPTSLACASAIGAALRTAGFTPSSHHAEAITGENRPFADQRNGVHYFDDLIVLKTAAVPAVLIEAGVIVNPDEESRLSDPATVAKIAGAIAAAAATCAILPARRG
jgi:N-acetylmuramoyl-L-alanine amidase